MKRSRLRSDRGAASVELALVLPVLLLVVFGIIDFGRAYNSKILIASAAREGARVAAQGGDAADVRKQVGRAMDGATVVVETPTLCDADDPDATVVVTLDFGYATPIGSIAGLVNAKFNDDNVTLRSEVTMPCRNN